MHQHTRSIGIRLPVKLWNYARAVDPDLSFSEIVRCALVDKYNFMDYDQVVHEVDLFLESLGDNNKCLD